MGKGLNQRREERLPLLINLKPKAEAGLILEPKDISPSGLGVYASQKLREDEEIGLLLELPSEIEPLEAKARIAWAKELQEIDSFPSYAGLKIEDMSSLDRARLLHFIESQKHYRLPIFWRAKNDLAKFKQNLQHYLYSFGKNIKLLQFSSPFVDFLGVDEKRRPVLIFVYDKATGEDIALVLQGVDWFLQKAQVLEKDYQQFSLKSAPQLLIFAFSFEDKFLRSFGYLKPLPCEIIEIEFIKSQRSDGVLAQRVLDSKTSLLLKEKNDFGALSQKNKKAAFADEAPSLREEEYLHLDKERRKIMKWLSKL